MPKEKIEILKVNCINFLLALDTVCKRGQAIMCDFVAAHINSVLIFLLVEVRL
jgi:hypothetical protein